MAQRKKSTTEQSRERMRAVNDRARVRIASEGEFDISFAPLSYWRERWPDKAVQRQFLENFIYIRSGADKNQLVRFKFNDVQADYHENSTDLDVILKARQQGFSTYVLAKKFAKAVIFSGTNLRLVPHDPDAEEEFWNRLDVMYQALSPHLKPETKYYSKEEIVFRDVAKGTVDSRITSLSPTAGKESKGRSQTLTDLHLTEVPFWQGDQRKTLNSLLTAAQHGAVTVESTAQGMEWFFKAYTQAKHRKSKYKAHFYEWWWTREYRVPGARFERARLKEWVLLQPHETLKDIWQVPSETLSESERAAKRNRFDAACLTAEEFLLARKILAHLKRKGYAPKRAQWHAPQVAEYIAWRRAKIQDIGERDFKVEYPENDRDCFENTGRTVISPAYLKVTCAPSLPQTGHTYLVSADTSLGNANSDPAAIEVIDLHTGRQVHSEELLRSPDLLAYRLVELSDLYHWAVIAVERNNTGIATVKKLLELVESERVYKELTRTEQRAVEEGKLTYEEAMEKAEFGIATTKANKGLMGVLLESAVRTGEIGLSSQEWCEQAQTVVWVNNDSWEAMPGFHDDKFMALAIANYVRVQALSRTTGFVGVVPQAGWARAK